MRTSTLGAAVALAVSLIAARPAAAAVPATIPFQGALTGVADGSRTAVFTLYDAASGGATLWTETKTITVAAGQFVTALGSATPFSYTVKFDKPYWVGVKVGDDPEMTPRLPLASVPYAMALPSITVDRSTGFVGINTSSPGSQLNVVGTIMSSGVGNYGHSVLGVSGSGNGSAYVTNPDGNIRVQMYATTNTGGRLDVDGSTGIARTGMYVDDADLGYLYADRLDFADTLGDKLLLYGGASSANYGLGIQSSLLQIHSDNSSSSIAFGYGSSEAFTERMRVTGGGRVGIGTASPTQALDVRGNIKMNSAGDMYAAGGQENLYIVRGIVNANGTIAAGSGFTVVHDSNGHYTVTLAKSEFDQPPAVAITPWTSQPVLAVMTSVSGVVGQPAKFSLATLQNGVGVNCGFSFIATAFH
jgi:hypothetical protein